MADPLDELLGIDPTQTADSGALVVAEPSALVEGEAVPAADDTPALSPDAQDLEKDFDVARKLIKDALEKVAPVLDSAILVAQSGDEPRAYEVVGGLMDSITNATRKLMDLHSIRKNVKEPPKSSANSTVAPPTVINNIDKAVFVGRASDLLRQIKQLQLQQSND